MAKAFVDDRLPAMMRDTFVGLVRLNGAVLSARQLCVLLICFLEDGPHTVRGLAEQIYVTRPVISRALDRLEDFDLVRRAPDPRDRRSVLVARTKAGAAYVGHIRNLLELAAHHYSIVLRPASASHSDIT